MRRFLISYWMLPIAVLVWAAFSITAAIQQEPIKAALGLGALICACGLTWHSWKGYTSKARPRSAALQAAPVQRDSEGYWTHPAHPSFDEDQAEEARAWFGVQQLEYHIAYLESEAEDHPAVVAYWGDAGDSNISAWEPPRPEGEGWFVLSIHDTEDWGPVCVWVRHAAQQGRGGAA
ncbi:hypothetical protein LMG26788_02145 [Achromobacter pulmonis]|uniref:Uncharacterized protein n=1 Tax=Achromobacter pulmonis TaxID=1389932 RepID=A0A6S7D3J1_9BURK|nr:hypothetical protein [Achromobacter pulmonis]CAB3858705.1 hypothetical protein LMG26788_02145 [Achromobacter pulmonis]